MEDALKHIYKYDKDIIKKNVERFTILRVILARGPLLCIIPILVYVLPKRVQIPALYSLLLCSIY